MSLVFGEDALARIVALADQGVYITLNAGHDYRELFLSKTVGSGLVFKLGIQIEGPELPSASGRLMKSVERLEARGDDLDKMLDDLDGYLRPWGIASRKEPEKASVLDGIEEPLEEKAKADGGSA